MGRTREQEVELTQGPQGIRPFLWVDFQHLRHIINMWLLTHLLVDSYCVQAVVHDVHPAVLGGQNEQGHQSLETRNTHIITFLDFQ